MSSHRQRIERNIMVRAFENHRVRLVFLWPGIASRLIADNTVISAATIKLPPFLRARHYRRRVDHGQ